MEEKDDKIAFESLRLSHELLRAFGDSEYLKENSKLDQDSVYCILAGIGFFVSNVIVTLSSSLDDDCIAEKELFEDTCLKLLTEDIIPTSFHKLVENYNYKESATKYN